MITKEVIDKNSKKYKEYCENITEDEINVYGLCDTHAKTACAVDCHDGSAFWTTIF